MRALWSDRQNCSHNVPQKVKRIRRFSDLNRRPCIEARKKTASAKTASAIISVSAMCWSPPLPESHCDRILFRPSWNMWRIFREISCSHFSWKFKDENLHFYSPKFLAGVSEKFRQNFALGEYVGNGVVSILIFRFGLSL